MICNNWFEIIYFRSKANQLIKRTPWDDWKSISDFKFQFQELIYKSSYETNAINLGSEFYRPKGKGLNLKLLSNINFMHSFARYTIEGCVLDCSHSPIYICIILQAAWITYFDWTDWLLHFLHIRTQCVYYTPPRWQLTHQFKELLF